MSDTREVGPPQDYAQAVFNLAMLQRCGFAVTIHSPATSPDGRFCVTAYGSGAGVLMLRGSDPHLTEAIRVVAEQARALAGASA